MQGCPVCGVELSEEVVRGVPLHLCPACEAVVVAREGVLRLRGAPREHPAMRAEAGAPSAQPKGERPCPACGAAMEAFHYRGGKTYVDRCSGCDLLFLDRGELRAILDEWEQGLEMSEEASAHLEGFQQRQIWSRLLSAEGALGSVGLISIAIFFRLACAYTDRYGAYRGYALPIPLAIAIAAGIYLYLRRRAKREVRQSRRAAKRYYRRREEGARKGVGARAASTETRGGEAAPGPKAGDRCPWCGALVFRGAKRCDACDSDIF